MNTFIVLTGLMLMVPDPDYKGLTILVVEAANAGDRYGTPIHKHEPKYSDLVNTATTGALTGNWEVNSSGTGLISIPSKNAFFDLDELYKQAPLSAVIPQCLGANFATAPECKINGKSMVVARIRVTGEWTVTPIPINIKKEPRAKVSDDSHYGFVYVPKGQLPLALRNVSSHLAGGVLLTHPAGKVVRISDGMTDYAAGLVEGTDASCDLRFGRLEKCKAFRFMNTTEHVATAGGVLEIEHDIDLLYDLLSNPPATRRYLPFMRLEDVAATAALGGGAAGSPDPRPCPPGTIKAQ